MSWTTSDFVKKDIKLQMPGTIQIIHKRAVNTKTSRKGHFRIKGSSVKRKRFSFKKETHSIFPFLSFHCEWAEILFYAWSAGPMVYVTFQNGSLCGLGCKNQP